MIGMCCIFFLTAEEAAKHSDLLCAIRSSFDRRELAYTVHVSDGSCDVDTASLLTISREQLVCTLPSEPVFAYHQPRMNNHAQSS